MGFIQGYQIDKDNYQIIVYLRFFQNKFVIDRLKFLSVPSSHRFLSYSELCMISNKKTFILLSTNKGLRTIYECKKLKIGGKLLFLKSNKKFLIFSSKLNSKLIEMPWFVVVKKIKDEIFFKNLDTNFTTFSEFVNFQKKLLYLLQTLDRTYKKHLII